MRATPPGRFIAGLHVRDLGSGPPFVVFEAGLAATSASWIRVQRELNGHAHTRSYDRAGLGWSPPAPGARTLRRWSDDLRRVIHDAGGTPAVLVGHSFGACIVRVYAHRFPDDVTALVLVDPMIPEEFAEPRFRTRVRLWRAEFFSYVTALCAAFGLVRLGLWALLRRGPGNAGPILGVSATARRIADEVAKLPPEAVADLRVHWTRPRFYRELAASIAALPRCAREATRHPVPPRVPVIVLSGSHQTPASLDHHRAIATRHLIVEGSAHWIHLDDPSLVANAILSVTAGPT
jgi:pimeloyl-ACP methyl ester carboxylesterase